VALASGGDGQGLRSGVRQANLQAPDELAGAQQAGVAGWSGRTTATATHPDLHPTVFNQEFSVNRSPNPAPAGGAVVLNTTGRGVTSPEGHFSPVGQRSAGAGRANRPAQPA